MQPSNRVLRLIERSEGFRPALYNDLAGHPTIGYGHRLLPGEDFPRGISSEAAEALLAHDTARAAQAVSRLAHVPLTQGQFDALVDFVFNLGPARLAGSTLLRLLNQGRAEDAARQLLRWDHVDGQPNAGLRARRQAELDLWNAPDASPAPKTEPAPDPVPPPALSLRIHSPNPSQLP